MTLAPGSALSVLVLVLLASAARPMRAADAAEPGAASVASVLEPFVESHTLAGAVTLAATTDKVLSLDAVGWADVAAKTPLKTDAVFWIASMSKPMTAAAFMMLVDEGKVKVDDPVEKYLPEFRGQMLAVERDKDHVLLKAPRHPITVREILSHTSGLPFMSPLESGKVDTLSLREAVLTYALGPLTFEPGSRYEYCNAGINTAGRIIEVLSGMPYEVFMEKRIFGPLGMKDTTFWPNEDQLKRLAKSYKPDAAKTGLEETPIGQMTYPLGDRRRGPSPAGGLFSTAADVGLFGRMVLAGGVFGGRRYLSEAAVREMTATQTGDLLSGGQGEGGYGFGWSTSRRASADTGTVIPGPCGHGGAHAANLAIDPGRGLVTVFMVQHAGFPGTDGGKILPAFQKAAEALVPKK